MMNSFPDPVPMTRHLAPLLSRLLVGLAVLGLAGCERAYFAVLNRGKPPVELSVGGAREYDPEHHLALDVYRPQGVARPPVLVFFHGGRWSSGSRAQYEFVARTFVARGMAVVLPDYRLYPGVKFPAFVDDAARAAAYVLDHAEPLGIDRSRVFLAGHSSGAHLAAMIATDGHYLAAHGHQPRDFAGVVGLAGPYDFLPLLDDDLKDMFGPPERYLLSQPIAFVDGDEPPFLLIHGTADRLAWPRNSEHLAARLAARGVPVELHLLPGVGHLRLLASLAEQERWLAPAVELSAAWIAKQPAVEGVRVAP
jgi:acetyl esterase/lipase